MIAERETEHARWGYLLHAGFALILLSTLLLPTGYDPEEGSSWAFMAYAGMFLLGFVVIPVSAIYHSFQASRAHDALRGLSFCLLLLVAEFMDRTFGAHFPPSAGKLLSWLYVLATVFFVVRWSFFLRNRPANRPSVAL